MKAVEFEKYNLFEYENGSIVVNVNGAPINPVKPTLRLLAVKLNLPILNANGNQHTTRTLGSLVISELLGRSAAAKPLWKGSWRP